MARSNGRRRASPTVIDPPPGVHQEERDLEPHAPQLVLERLDSREGAGHIGVEHCGGGALVLADGRVQRRARYDGQFGVQLGDGGHGLFLVGRVGEGPQEGHGERLHPLLLDQSPHTALDLVEVERHDDFSRPVDPLVDGRDDPTGEDGGNREPAVLVHDSRPAGDGNHLLEAAGCQQTDRPTGAGRQDVGHGGRPQTEPDDRGQQVPQGDPPPPGRELGCGQNPLADLARGRRRLGPPCQGPVGQHAVGEGAPDIDTDECAVGKCHAVHLHGRAVICWVICWG